MATTQLFLTVLLSAIAATLHMSASAAAGNYRPGRSTRSVFTLTAEVVNSTSVSLKWHPQVTSQDGGGASSDDVTCPRRQFLIRLKQDAARRVRTWKVDGSRSSVSLHGLLADTVYYVRIVSIDCQGQSRPSRWVNVRTDPPSTIASTRTQQSLAAETTGPGQPIDVNTKSFSDSILVSWNAPQDGGVVRGYVVGYGEGVPDVSWQYLEAHRRNVTIKNLKKDTQYVISVRAFNNVAKGPVVYDLVFTTDSDSTGETAVRQQLDSSVNSLLAPTNVQTKVLSATTVWLQWTDPSIGRTQLVPDSRFYSVHYQAVSGSMSLRNKALSAVARDLHVILYNLQPATKYEFKVRTVKDSLTSPYSATVNNRTFETAPSSAPRDVRVTQLVDDVTTSVEVKWRPPRHSNGNITEYLLFYTYNDSLPAERWFIESSPGSQTLFTLHNTLNTSLTYYFRLQARNSHGFGPKSDVVTLHLQPTAARQESRDLLGGGEEFDEETSEDKLSQHYDYIENDDSTNNNNNSSTAAVGVVSNKSKREPNIQSMTDSRPVGSESTVVSLTTQIVPFQVLITHRVSVYLTWPAHTNQCETPAPVAGLGQVIGYRLRYWRVLGAGPPGEYVSRYLTQNVVLLEGLMPNSLYRYQMKYITQPADGGQLGEEEVGGSEAGGWSQEAELNTSANIDN